MTNKLHVLAVVLGVAASILAVLSVAVFEGYFPASVVDNLTWGELAGLSALSVVGAVGCSLAAGNPNASP